MSGSAISCPCSVTFLLLRYNPYTQTVEVLNNSDKILDMAKELKGDLAIVASALRKVQERDGELDPSVVSTFLTAGLDISPYGSRYSPLWVFLPMVISPYGSRYFSNFPL